ncbi:MAG: Nramp family divalent metal transporter [Acidobacteriota bacterium]|nr:MAG: Nramp family divalent metal transporter [Acidobacteriota bacterium]
MEKERVQKEVLREPPRRLIDSIRYLGPGLILSAAIVGSGELIATTALGARAGFTFLWIILLGCLIKVAVQLEYGRNCILYGQSSFQAWNTEKRGRILGLHWSVIIAFLFLISMFIGLAGVIGGAAQVALSIFPGIPIPVWILLVALFIALPIYRGKYKAVEVIATTLNMIFVLAVGYCVIAVQGTIYSFGLSDLTEGLKFQLPPGALALAIGAFGITGVGSAEIFTYPSWCLEKGYARWTGPADGSEDWIRRARGWIRVMRIDALVAMVVYTITTCAFYILGATVLQPQERLADGNELIVQLSVIFTEVLGQQAWFVFMIGAFAVLFSTVFSNAAGYSRLWTDFFVEARLIPSNDQERRRRSIAIMAWVLPIVWGAVYLTFQKPLFLVVFMGISNSLFLLVVAYKAIVFHYRNIDTELRPSQVYRLFFWLSVISIGLMAAWALYSTLGS